MRSSVRGKKSNYVFNKIKPVILYCWDYRCYICGKQDFGHHVHHVDLNHWNNLPVNLIPLCSYHHKLVHKNLLIDNIIFPDYVAERLFHLENNMRKMFVL